MSKEEKAAYAKAYHESNKEKIAAKKKDYQEANKEKIAARNKAYRAANPEKEKEWGKKYREKKKKELLAKREAFYLANKDEVDAQIALKKEQSKLRRAEWRKEWRLKNAESIKEKAKIRYEKGKKDRGMKERIRKESDPVFAMKLRVKGAIIHSIKKKGFTKESRSHEVLGCDWETFKAHIESRFMDGMSWENRDEWQIDHIIPVSLAQDEEAVITLNHYLNLRPLWASENLEKSDKMPSMDLIKQYGADVIFNKLKGI